MDIIRNNFRLPEYLLHNAKILSERDNGLHNKEFTASPAQWSYWCLKMPSEAFLVEYADDIVCEIVVSMGNT